MLLLDSDMYANAIDEGSGTLVGLFHGSDTSSEQYELSLHAMHRVDSIAASQGLPFIYVAIVGADVERPPAVWRKRFSDANHNVKSERFYFVMVTTSMLMRGVFTAVNWITPPRAGQHYAAASTLQEAQLWLRRHGASAPDLSALEARARKQCASANG